MPQPSLPKIANKTQETEKALAFVVKKIREGILDGVFKPGDHLGEVELATRFEVKSRSPVREALLVLEKEGTVLISPYKGAIVKPLSAAEVLDIAELRLAAISLAIKPAHRHLSPADLDHAYDLAKRLTRIDNLKQAPLTASRLASKEPRSLTSSTASRNWLRKQRVSTEAHWEGSPLRSGLGASPWRHASQPVRSG